MRIRGLGRSEGERVLTNEMLEARLDTSDEWIRARTGICERRIVGDGQTPARMGAEAARQALKRAERDEVDVVIVATTTPDTPCPSTAAWVQEELGLSGGAFDVQAACSGWVYGLVVAAGLMGTGTVASALVIGTEALSTIVDAGDRSTAPLFGDAAGAAVLEHTEGSGDLVSSDLGNDGSLAHLIQVPAGGAREPVSHAGLDEARHKLQMAGPEVFRVATRVIVDTCERSLAKAGRCAGDVDLFVPHQANARIISHARGKLGIPPERTMVNIDRYGNTSAASIPVALCEAWEQGRLRTGDTVLLAGFGAGMSWASALLDWSLV